MSDKFRKNIGRIEGVVAKLNARTEGELIRLYAQSLRDIRAQMAEIYAKYAKGGELTYNEMAKYGRLESLFGEINVQLKDMTGKSARQIKGLQAEVYSESYYRTAFAFELEAHAKLRYVLLNPKTIEASIQNPISGLTLNARLQKQRADIILQTRTQITQGLIKGESYDDVARRLKGVFEDDLVKSRRVVRTESHRNHIQGNLDSAMHAADYGVKAMKVWQATLDNKTRDSHQDMDCQKVKLDEMFIFQSGDNKGDETEGPGLSGIPEEDINCRCVMREEIVGYEPSIRGARDEGNIPYQTYEEWADDKGI